MLIRLWEKYGAECRRRMTAIECILAMAPIDLPLALKWSAERGRQHDSRVRQPIAAEQWPRPTFRRHWHTWRTIVTGRTQSFLLKLADRFVVRDRAKALRFADEALARVRELERERAANRTGGDRRGIRCERAEPRRDAC